MSPSIKTPHEVLGVSRDAPFEEFRQAYLALVREYPPSRDPDKFREIHQAYQMLSDPLQQAETLLKAKPDRPNLSQFVETAATRRVRLPVLSLLALGNQE